MFGHLCRDDTLDLISPSQPYQLSAWLRTGTMGQPQATLRIEKSEEEEEEGEWMQEVVEREEEKEEGKC